MPRAVSPSPAGDVTQRTHPSPLRPGLSISDWLSLPERCYPIGGVGGAGPIAERARAVRGRGGGGRWVMGVGEAQPGLGGNREKGRKRGSCGTLGTLSGLWPPLPGAARGNPPAAAPARAPLLRGRVCWLGRGGEGSALPVQLRGWSAGLSAVKARLCLAVFPRAPSWACSWVGAAAAGTAPPAPRRGLIHRWRCLDTPPASGARTKYRGRVWEQFWLNVRAWGSGREAVRL